MKIVIGTNNGLVKVIVPEKSKVLWTWGTQNSALEIDDLVWGNGQQEIAFAMKNGSVKIYDITKASGSMDEWQLDLGSRSASIHLFQKSPETRRLAACGVKGQFQLFTQGQEQPSKQLEVLSGNAVDIARMRVEDDEELFAVGGKEQELAVYDIEKSESQKPFWVAKNVPNDKLSLRVPVWIRDFQFFHGDRTKLAMCSSYRHLRVYDTKAQRRPVIDAELSASKAALSTMVLSNDNMRGYVADTLGNLFTLDMRNLQMLYNVRGIAGSLRSLSQHKTLPLLASGGLDRFLRVHDVNTRKTTYKIYVKQKINHVLFSDEEELIEVKEEEAVDENAGENIAETAEPTAEEQELDTMLARLKSTEDGAEADNDEHPKTKNAKKQKKQKKLKAPQDEEDDTPASAPVIVSPAAKKGNKKRQLREELENAEASSSGDEMPVLPAGEKVRRKPKRKKQRGRGKPKQT